MLIGFFDIVNCFFVYDCNDENSKQGAFTRDIGRRRFQNDFDSKIVIYKYYTGTL